MEIAKSFEELQELIGKDLAEEVVASYPNIVNEKVINYYPNQLDWAESIIYHNVVYSFNRLGVIERVIKLFGFRRAECHSVLYL